MTRTCFARPLENAFGVLPARVAVARPLENAFGVLAARVAVAGPLENSSTVLGRGFSSEHSVRSSFGAAEIAIATAAGGHA